METLKPGSITLDFLEKLFRNKSKVSLDIALKDKVEKAAKIVEDAARGNSPVYGVNTGFGKLANKIIPHEDREKLQKNLVLSHCSGVGEPLQEDVTRLMMILKIISLSFGASGVKWSTINQIEKIVNSDIVPEIPHQGSVGASGDLAPLAHMAAVMIGEGWAYYKGEKVTGGEALKKAKIDPIILGPKEGLALLNGTQFSTACALANLYNGWRSILNSIVISSLSTDAIMGSTSPLLDEIHTLRGHKGQIFVAKKMRDLMSGSIIRESHREDDQRVQDPYCIRCQPQVLGACLDVLKNAGATIEIEANAVTDNPLVLVDEGRIVSGGNFHAEPIGFAADQIALALAEMGSISQRRVALMVDPTLSHDLPAFLTDNPGLNSGFMIAEVTSAALMSENKHLANPTVTDSTPTSANQEDHVSMAAHGAYRLFKMNKNLSSIFGIELLCAAQGIDAREPLKTSPLLEKVKAGFRKQISRLKDDRYMATDINKVTNLLESNFLIKEAELNIPFSSFLNS
ncbi:MAG: histidine ammonia-lyase [SAR116 cluster bacterium]|nr:histidine ammonia-lyase [SAR116 cluster bacterium]|tara:strand:+ start:256 stop:1797 length:1542 start_codon:yes stop_codon:yes gene_type:complete